MNKNLKNKKAFSLIELSIVLLIIGVIVAGITQSSRLINAFKLNTARNITKSSPVASINGLALWLETSLDESLTGATVTSPDDGDNIARWNDINPQNTSKINFSIGSNYPTYKASGINGLPSVKFNGTNQALTNTTQGPISAGSDTYTMFMVWRIDAVGAVRNLFSQGSNPTVVQTMFNYYTAASPAYLSFGGHGNDFNSASATVIALRDYIGAMSVNNNNANNISIYFNSNTPIVGASSGGTAGLNIASTFASIGYYPGSPFYYYNGLISEIIVYDKLLKTEEIIAVNNYLSKKYAIKLT